MKVLGINRVELLVADQAPVQATLKRLFNGAYFTSDAATHNRPMECCHDWQHGVELVCPKDPTDNIGKQLAERGEGAVLTVVYEVEDLGAAREHLTKNGFRIQYEGNYDAHPDVDVYRQLCVRREDTHGFFVTFMQRRWKPGAKKTAEPIDPNGMKVLGINRAEILVADPDVVQATFTRLFNGATFHRDGGVHGRPLDCRVDWEHGLELVHPTDPTDNIGQQLARRGEGAVLTIVFDVDDMAKARDYLTRNGFEIQYDADYGADEVFEVSKQIVVRATGTHGLLVTFRESRRRGA